MHFTQPTHSTPAARSSSALIRITTDSPRFAGSGRTDCALGRWGTNANWSEDRSHTPCLLGGRSRPRRSVLLAVGPRNGPADLAKRTDGDPTILGPSVLQSKLESAVLKSSQ